MVYNIDEKESALEDLASFFFENRLPSKEWRKRSNTLLVKLFFDLCGIFKIASFVECGAHSAEASRQFMADRGGIAIALEANPFTFRKLTKPAEKYGVIVKNLGAGTAAGMRTLHIPNPLRLDCPVTSTASFSRRTSGKIEYLSLEVKVTTVDAMVSQYMPMSSVAMWIDVEGHGMDILLGAKNTLSSGRCPLVFIETENYLYWEKQSLSADIRNYLAGYNYLPVARDEEWNNQFNYIFIRESSCQQVKNMIDSYWKAALRKDRLLIAGLKFLHAMRISKTFVKIIVRRALKKVLGERWFSAVRARWKSII